MPVSGLHFKEFIVGTRSTKAKLIWLVNVNIHAKIGSSGTITKELLNNN